MKIHCMTHFLALMYCDATIPTPPITPPTAAPAAAPTGIPNELPAKCVAAAPTPAPANAEPFTESQFFFKLQHLFLYF